jgi:hypothetical protein
MMMAADQLRNAIFPSVSASRYLVRQLSGTSVSEGTWGVKVDSLREELAEAMVEEFEEIEEFNDGAGVLVSCWGGVEVVTVTVTKTVRPGTNSIWLVLTVFSSARGRLASFEDSCC